MTELIHESCISSKNGDFRGGLDKAKEAAKRERLVARQREASSASSDPNPPPPNLDLTYCVLFNLGNHYQNCKMHQEALNTYAIIVKNKAFAQSGRLRVNMGNIFFDQQNFSQAVKMYRMALDQIASANKIMRLKILMNIGIAFIKMSQFADAASSFEAIMEVSPDHRAGEQS